MAGGSQIKPLAWLGGVLTTGMLLVSNTARGQEESVNSQAWSAPSATAVPLARAAQQAQQERQSQLRNYQGQVQQNYQQQYEQVQGQIRTYNEYVRKYNRAHEAGAPGAGREERLPEIPEAGPGAAAPPPTPPPDVPAGEIPVNLNFMGRAALIGNSTRLSGPGNFLPSQIPAPGQQFFGAPGRAAVSADGNFVNLSAAGTTSAGAVGAKTIVGVTGGASTDAAAPAATAFVQQAYGQFNGLTFGIAETVFANVSALPETLDLAGPNARVSALSQGVGTGQARLSYAIVTTQEQQSGFAWLVSLENPIPEIETSSSNFGPPTGANTATFSRCPDFITSLKYTSGCMRTTTDGSTATYVEAWDLQFASLCRDLAYGNDTNVIVRDAFGWGESLSGSFRFAANPKTTLRDRACFSVTYGQGISHYIVDVSTPSTSLKNVGYDAMLSGSNLMPLPLFAWYVNYQHNWCDVLRSNFTYSHVTLDSVDPVTNPLAYHAGEYMGANIVYHTKTRLPGEVTTATHQFSCGVEYLYGEKEILNGKWGNDHQLMVAVSLTK